mgnify:CR=1 FL=1
MKTKKYQITVFIDDMLTFKTIISKKEYLRLMKELRKQHSSHCNLNEEFYTEHEYKCIERETYNIYENNFSYLTSNIILREYVCDTGFHF